MKKLALLILISLFVFTACQDDSTILEPANNYSVNDLSKGRPILNYDSNDLILTNDTNLSEEPNWITLPKINEVSVSKMVNGADETLLDLNTSIQGGIFNNIQVNATLRFKRGSFIGSRYVTMSISSESGTASFSPSGSFDIPAIYNSTIMGLDLRGIDPSEISFVYMAKDGKYHSIDVQHILVEPQSGKLQVIDAELPHFSRYGWTRTTTTK